MKEATFIGVATALLLVIAVADLPYGYYEFLRLAVTVAAVWLAVLASQSNEKGWLLFLVPMAILFNPVMPVYLTKEIWTPINLLGALAMFIAGRRISAAHAQIDSRGIAAGGSRD